MYQSTAFDNRELLATLKTDHLETLTAPLDAYWEEAVIGFSDHYEIQCDGKNAGFFCLNGDKQLIAFYLTKEFGSHGEDSLSYVIKEHGVTAAMAGTNDPFFLSLCLDRTEKVAVHTLLFQDNTRVTLETEGFGDLSFELAKESAFDEVFENYSGAGDAMDTDSVETGFEDLKSYIRSVMADHHIYILREDGSLIATSECRISKTQKPYADVGMIVATDQRRRGVGSHILNLTKELCYELDLRPICSCEAGNIGSKKAIAKAGFVSRHRVLQIELTH